MLVTWEKASPLAGIHPCLEGKHKVYVPFLSHRSDENMTSVGLKVANKACTGPQQRDEFSVLSYIALSVYNRPISLGGW